MGGWAGPGAGRDPSLSRGYSKARLHLTTGLSQSKEKQKQNDDRRKQSFVKMTIDIN